MNKKERDIWDRIQLARYENYSIHYDRKVFIFEHMPADQRDKLATRFSYLAPFPLLTITGSTPEGWITPAADYMVRRYSPEIRDYLNPWYLTDYGWTCFQRLWAALPEPSDLWITRSKLWITHIKSVDKSVCKPVDKSGGYPQKNNPAGDKLASCPQPVDKSTSYPQPHVDNSNTRFIVSYPSIIESTGDGLPIQLSTLSTSPTAITNP